MRSSGVGRFQARPILEMSDKMPNADTTTLGNGTSRGSQPSSEKVAAVVKALFVSFSIATLGILPWPILAQLNLKYWPHVPWSAVGTIVYLSLLWRYLSGAGWPASTATYRRTSLRAGSIDLTRWGLAVIVAVGGAIALVALHLLCIKEGEFRFRRCDRLLIRPSYQRPL
jgi:hypothetical protein